MAEWRSPTAVHSSCGSDGGGFTPDKFIDGNIGTRWRHQIDEVPHWIILDLGATMVVRRVRIYTADINCTNGPVTFYVSDDPGDFGANVGIGTFSAYPEWKEVDLTDKAGRYIKMTIVSWMEPEHYMHAVEFEFSCLASPAQVNLEAGYADVDGREDLTLAVVASSGYQVVQSSDDCQEIEEISFSLDGQILAIGKATSEPPSPSCNIGVRFQNVAVPKDATIALAYLRFFSEGNDADPNNHADIWGNDVDDAATFSNLADYLGRALTTAKVDWNSIETWVQYGWYNTPNIKTIVQEIVNRALWVSGNAMAFIIKDDGSDDSVARNPAPYDWGDGGWAPKLIVLFE